MLSFCFHSLGIVSEKRAKCPLDINLGMQRSRAEWFQDRLPLGLRKGNFTKS